MRTDNGLLPRDGRILCAVSGGVDSMYLLCRMEELGFSVAAAHYNHGLRGAEADRDEEFVRAFCRGRDIECVTERGDVRGFAEKEGMGLEAAARTLRYAFLERAADETGAEVIATAHTADDNAETVLLRLTRGAGLTGLCGIPPRRGRIVRPMLDVTRAEAEAYLAARGIPHVEDSTNGEDDYARNRIRHHVIPALAGENPGFVRAVARMTELLRADEMCLSAMAEDFLREHGDGDGLPVRELLALPGPVAGRVVRLAAGTELSRGHTDAILDIAARGGQTDVPGLRAAVSAGRLYLGAAPAAPMPDRPVTPGNTLYLPEAGLYLRCAEKAECPSYVYKSFNTFYFKCENICGNMTVGSRKEGDRYRPAGRGCTKGLKALFRERGVPPWERDRVPVLRDGQGVLALCGAPPAERACAAPGDRNVIEIEFFRRLPDDGGI